MASVALPGPTATAVSGQQCYERCSPGLAIHGASTLGRRYTSAAHLYRAALVIFTGLSCHRFGWSLAGLMTTSTSPPPFLPARFAFYRRHLRNAPPLPRRYSRAVLGSMAPPSPEMPGSTARSSPARPTLIGLPSAVTRGSTKRPSPGTPRSTGQLSAAKPASHRPSRGIFHFHGPSLCSPTQDRGSPPPSHWRRRN